MVAKTPFASEQRLKAIIAVRGPPPPHFCRMTFAHSSFATPISVWKRVSIYIATLRFSVYCWFDYTYDLFILLPMFRHKGDK